MSIRDQIQKDLDVTLSNTQGFGNGFTLTDPSGAQGNFIGQTGDIGELIDPDTGLAVSGRLAFAVVAIGDLQLSGLTGFPIGISDKNSKPWLCEFGAPATSDQCYKVKSTMPDRTVGVIKMILELYDNG